MRMHSERGFSVADLTVAMAVAAILIGGLVWGATAVLERGRTTSLANAVDQLTTSTESFVATGGVFPASATAEEALLLLQTPVDAASRKAGIGLFPQINYRWVLEPVATDDDGPRLAYSFESPTRAPTWSIANTGAGYRVLVAKGITEPAVADWSARVAKAGHVGATTSPWLWDFKDVTPTTGPSTTPPAAGGSPIGPSVLARLQIDGPTEITSPGTYYWWGTSSLSGNLRISVNDVPVALAGVTRIESVSRNVAPGETGQFVVVFEMEGQGSVQRIVPISVPSTPSIAITGPDMITNLQPERWTATTLEASYPITIKVDDRAQKKADGASITSDPARWLPSVSRDVKILASAINASGLVTAEKIVRLRIPPVPTVTWDRPPELTTDSVIRAPGTYRFVLRETNPDNAAGPGRITASASATGEITISGDSVDLSGATEAPLVITVDAPSDPTRSYNGEINLAGSLTTEVGTGSASLRVDVALPPTEKVFTWTVTAAGVAPSKIDNFELFIVKNGVNYLTRRSPGGSLTGPFTVSLGVGQYIVRAQASVSTTTGIRVIPATVGDGVGSELSLEVLP